MKKLILLASIFCFVQVSAQTFVLTPKGMVDSLDNSKNYIVVPVEGFSKDAIFNAAHNYITSSYVSAKEVMSVSGTDMIAVNGIAEVPFSDGMHKCTGRINYHINIEFKDNRYKIDFSFVSMNMVFNHSDYPLLLVKQGMSNGIFKKDNTLTKGGTMCITDIENIPNNMILGIKNNLKSTKASEDW